MYDRRVFHSIPLLSFYCPWDLWWYFLLISDISNLCLLSFSAWLKAYQFYWSSSDHFFKTKPSQPHSVVRLLSCQFLQNSTSSYSMLGSIHGVPAQTSSQYYIGNLLCIGKNFKVIYRILFPCLIIFQQKQ